MFDVISYPVEFKELLKKIQRKHPNVDLLEIDGIGSQTDINEYSKKFFGKIKATADISIDANANIEQVTLLQYHSEMTKPIHRLNTLYQFWKYAKDLYNEDFANLLVEKQLDKTIYINDAGSLVCYCFNFTCLDIVFMGLPFTTKAKSEPPKNLASFKGQVTNFITTAGNSIAGAVGVADFLICLSWYVEKLRKENIDVPKKYLDKQIKQEIQSFIYDVNQPFRGGLQSFFTNISIYDDVFLSSLCDEYIFTDNSKVSKETVKEMQEVYLDLMNEILHKSPVTFPVTTACFAVDDKKKILDRNFLTFIADKNRKYGFINIYAGATSTLSSCCRLRSSKENIGYTNSFGAGSNKIGSLGVCTINLPRLAYRAKSEEDFMDKVQYYTEFASKVNHVKRYIIKKRIASGHYPLYSLGFMDLKKQYSTCGVIGINEMCEILKKPILTKEGQALVLDTLDIINKVNAIQEKKYKYPTNCEQIPGETVAIKLAEVDYALGYNVKKDQVGLKQYKLYSNQFIPLTTEADMYDRIKLQGMFDSSFQGGSICHLNIADEITDSKYIERLIEHAVNQGVIYFAINYNLQACEDDHLHVGKSDKCQVCGKPITNNWTRVVGFLVSVANFHPVRRLEDAPNRKWYSKETLK
jgi:ribonucleoside-triphosphate reductase